MAALLAESARLKHAGLDLRKLEDPRRRPAPAATERAGQELQFLLTAAEREAEKLARTTLVLRCSAATIRQTEATFAAAEESGALPASPQGDHPGLLVLRFTGPDLPAEATTEMLQAVFGEDDAFTLHATAAEAFQAAPGLRVERVAGQRDALLLVVRATPGPEGAALLQRLEAGEPAFLAMRVPRATALRRIAALQRLLTRWESTHLPLLNLFNPDARSWGDAQALNLGDATEDWFLLPAAATGAREFVRKAIGSPDFALLEADAGPTRVRATAELLLQCLRRGQRVLLLAETTAELEATLAALAAAPAAAPLVAPLRFTAEGEVATAQRRGETFANRVTGLMQVGPARLRREEAERVALAAANVVAGTYAGLARQPMLRPAALARDAEGFDHLIVLGADRLAFRDFLPLAVHAAKWTLIGGGDGQPAEPGAQELAALVADEAERAGRFAELQAELAYKACVGKDGSADDEDAGLADVHGRRKVLLILETPGDESRALATAVQHLRQRQLNVVACPTEQADAPTWATPPAETNVIVATRAGVERSGFLARLPTDYRLVVTDAPPDLLTPLAARSKTPKTRGKAAKPRPLIVLSWSGRTTDNLRGLQTHRRNEAARGEHARALLLDLRSIFPFEKPLWEPQALLTLKERALASAFEVLDIGVRDDTGTGRSELAYHSGLPRPGSHASRKEVLR